MYQKISVLALNTLTAMKKLGWFLNEKFYRNKKLFHIKASRFPEKSRDNWI